MSDLEVTLDPASDSPPPSPRTHRRRPVLEQRKAALSSLFGMVPWVKPQSKSIEAGERGSVGTREHVTFGNVVWVVLVGWWLAALFALLAGLLALTVIGIRYARLALSLARYVAWPFGVYLVEHATTVQGPTEGTTLLVDDAAPARGPGYIVWLALFGILVAPALLLVIALSWFFVVTMPMAKLHWTVLRLLVLRPHLVHVAYHSSSDIGRQASLLATYRAFNPYYLRYSVWGMNIIFVNLVPLVVFRVLLIVLHMANVHAADFIPPVPRFVLNILCTIPITFLIGHAIAAIAVQTSYMIGAILNATFGSMTELLLFTLALRTGALNDLILYSLTGSLLCDMLLLPGLSMIAGGIRYKEQKFNANAAGVGSILLFIAIVGAFTPTIFFHAFGGYQQECDECVVLNNSKVSCRGCHYTQTDLRHDSLFMDSVRPLMWISAGVLPFAYIIGMLFTFKTHSHIFQQDEAEPEEGDGGPVWGIVRAVAVMMVAVACHGLIAEDLVSVLEGVLHELGIKQSFMGITVIALTPAATEIANAIKFALSNQISLSVEIGSASSVQVALIQMPALTIIATIFNAIGTDADAPPFNLIFPLLNVFAVILAVITFNYISTDGRTNYFIGASMVVMYTLLLSAFYFVPDPLTPVNATRYSATAP